MKITRIFSIAFLSATLFMVSCKDEAAEREAEEKMEMEKQEAEMEQKRADSLAMVETQKRERDERATSINGAMMYDDMTIVENASTSDDLSTLVAAVKAADLVETLNSEGPFTVFAPTNAAFDKLPAGTVDNLMKAENKAKLKGVLTYHVVSGNVMAADLQKMIKDGNGTATLKTVNGGQLTAMVKDGKVRLKDAKGNTSTVTVTDVKQSNGVVHVIDTVVMPSA
ncbi:fasciclin domain-containing protein [Nonlabens spongiae]|nr:fasciclin domain-containing protein [Nonlabens spongiae]